MESSWNFESFDDPWDEAVATLLNKTASQELGSSSPIRFTSSSKPIANNTTVGESPALLGHLTITASSVGSTVAMGSDSSSIPKSPLMSQEAPRDVPKVTATAEQAVGAPSHVDFRSFQPSVPAPVPVADGAIVLEPNYILSDDFNAMKRMINKQTLPANTFSAFWKCLKGKISLSWRIIGYGRHLPDHILYDPQLIFTRQEGLKFDNLHKYVPEWDYFMGAKSLIAYLRYQARLLEHVAVDAALAPLEVEIETTQIRLAAATTATSTASLDDGAPITDGAQDGTGRRGSGKKRKSSSLGGGVGHRSQRRHGEHDSSIDDSSSCASSASFSSYLHPPKRRKHRSGSDASDDCEFDASASSDSSVDDDSDKEFSISSQSKPAKHSSSVGPQFQVHYIPPCQPRPALTADELSSIVSNRVWSPSCVDALPQGSGRRKGKRKSKGETLASSSSFAMKQEDEAPPSSLSEESLTAQQEARCCDYLASGMVRAMRSQLWTGCYQPSFRWQGKCITASSSKMAAPVHARGSVCLVDAADHPDAALTLNVAHGKDLRLVCVVDYYLQPPTKTNSNRDLAPSESSKKSSGATDGGGEDSVENTQSTHDLQQLLTETATATATVAGEATEDNHEAVWHYEVYDGQTVWHVHPQHVVRALPHFTLPGSVDGDRPIPIHFPANEEMLLHLLYHEGGDVVQACRYWKKLCKLARRSHTAAETDADHDDDGGAGGEASQGAALHTQPAAPSAKDEAVLKLFQHLSGLQLDATQFVPWSAADFDVLRTCWDPRQSTGGVGSGPHHRVTAAMSSSSDDSAQLRAMQNLPSWIAKQINNGTPIEFASANERLDLDNYMPPLRDWYLRYKRASASSRKKAVSNSDVASDAPQRCHPRTFKSFFMGVLCLWPSLVKQRGGAMAEMFRLPWTASSAGPTEDGIGDGSKPTDVSGVNVPSDLSEAVATTGPAAEPPLGVVVADAATMTIPAAATSPSAMPTVTVPVPVAELQQLPPPPPPPPPPVVEVIDLLTSSAPDDSDLDDVIFIEDD